jgi:uncharacterized membrane protein
MAKVIVILLIALVVESVGVAFLSRGLKQVGEMKQVNVPEIAGLVKRGAANRNILVGILFETIFFIALLYLLSSYDVSLIWPLTALGFVLTALMAKFFLQEQVSALRWMGVGLIVVGAAIVSYSEKIKEKKPVVPSASADVSAHSH